MMSNELQTLEKERATLTQEMAGIERLTQSDRATVDELEKALTRKGALEIRARAVGNRIAAERARLAEEEAQKRKQEAAALKGEADAVMHKVIDALMALQPLGEQHQDLMRRVQTLGGASYSGDNRGQTLCNTINGLLQTLAPGRFYPIDQRGTLKDRTQGG